MSIDGWMYKWNMVYTYNKILFTLKKEGNPGTCYNMGDTGGHYVKWNKPDTKGQMLWDSTYVN